MATSLDDLTCRELVELVTEHLEGRLGPAERARFDAHLAWCLGCRGHVRAVRRTVSLLGVLGRRGLV
jgi:anti-sigma factor RsiW